MRCERRSEAQGEISAELAEIKTVARRRETTANQENARWLLLIHQIPPKPEYLRVKIWRRMQRIGAVAVKNSVYVLPKNEEALEDFQWILREINAGGGEGSICEAGFVDGLFDADIEAMFRSARDADYSAISEEARELDAALPPP